MTDTNHLTRIRELAEQGRELAQKHESAYAYDDEVDPYAELCVSFEAILHNLNQMGAAMATDTTEEPQWWRVDHDKAGWGVCRTSELAYLLGAWQRTDAWQHTATVKCPPNATEHDIYQDAVDAWAEAGFAHAPKEPPAPRQVEVAGWAVIYKTAMLTSVLEHGLYTDLHGAERAKSLYGSAQDNYRIVRVDAVVSEVEG